MTKKDISKKPKKNSDIKQTKFLNKKLEYIKNNKLKISLVVWYAFCWSWVLFTDTLDLAGNPTQGFIIALIVLIINVIISTYIILRAFKFVGYLFKTRSNLTAAIFAWPVFSLADFLVAWIPAFIWIGPQGRADSVLPLSTPTLAAINTPFGFSSRIIGFFGLGGLIWLTVYFIVNKNLRKLAVWPFAVLAVISLLGWYIWKDVSGSKLKATVISEKLDDRVETITDSNTDLVVFPEYGLDEIDDNNFDERIDPIEQNKKVFFLGSTQINPNDKVGHLNRLLYGDTQNGITIEQDKYRLIPGGEDLPYLVRTGLRATNQKSTLDYFSYAKGTLKGQSQLAPFETQNNTLVGAAVCSSIISPSDYREFADTGATFFTNSASLTIFKGSPLFAWQQKSLAKFMAVANSRYFLQSANSARAFILDNNGKTVAQTSDKKTLTENIQNNSEKTIFTKFGDFFVFFGLIIILLITFKKSGLWKKFDNFIRKT